MIDDMKDRYAYNPADAPAPNVSPPSVSPPSVSPEIIYRRSLRHDIMMIVLMLLAFYAVISTLPSIIVLIPMFFSDEFARLLAGDLSTQVTTLSESDFMKNLTPIAAMIAEAAALPLFIAVRGKSMFTTDVFLTRERMRPAVFIRIFVIAFGAQFVFSSLAELLNALLGKVGYSATDMYSAAMESMMSLPGYIYIMLLGPIMEELVFRSAIMKKLERYGANFAIVMSAMFFACYHIFFVQVIFAFPVGILLGYVAYRYSVKYSILMHILYNSAAMLAGAALPNPYIEWIVFAAMFAAAVALLILNRREIGRVARAGKPAAKGTWAIAFSGASVILFLVGVMGLSVLLTVFTPLLSSLT
jgi:membrane protease YdiL (CAAX protease family)